jgi:FixJ family two-component response regulator
MTVTDELGLEGVTGAEIRNRDWSASCVGATACWSKSFRAALAAVLRSTIPACLACGPELRTFYNDASVVIFGVRPGTLGEPIQRLWPGEWDELDPLVTQARSGVAGCLEELPLTLNRTGVAERTWWAVVCMPACSSVDEIDGVLLFAYETTNKKETSSRPQVERMTERPSRFDNCEKQHCLSGLAHAVLVCGDHAVYIVDGSAAEQCAFASALRDAGYHVKLFANVRAFLEDAHVLVPGCVVLDVGTLNAASIASTREVSARNMGLPVVVTGKCLGDVGLLIRAMKSCVFDYLEAPCTKAALLSAVESALVDVSVTAKHDHVTNNARMRVATLSAREREVLHGLLAGGTNKTIGKELGISPRTVEIHRAHVMERLGARSLPELVLKGAAGLQFDLTRLY